MKKLGRNEPCACGSGKKYKNCHQAVDRQQGPGKRNWVIAGVVAILALFTVLGLFFNSPTPSKSVPENAPPGKVWSEEHGHWHDAG